MQETQSYQRFQHIGHTAFNTSGTNAPRSLSRAKVGTHSAFGERSHTRAHTAKQEPSLLRSQCGFVLPAKSLLFHRAFIYIHFPVLCGPHYQQQLYLRPSFIAFFNFSHKWPTFAFAGESGYTLGSLRKIAHKGSHAETGVFRTGVVSLPSERSTRFGNPAWPGFKTANFAAFGSWPGVLRRTQRASGQRCAYARRCSAGVAAPLGCVIPLLFLSPH